MKTFSLIPRESYVEHCHLFPIAIPRHIRDLWFNRNRTKSTLREGYLFTEMRREEEIFRIPANFVPGSKTPFRKIFTRKIVL